MRFVHLAPQPKIGNIKRSGIRCGDGRRARGVYAGPLMMMQRASRAEDDRIIPSDPRSSGTLWQWLARGHRRHRNLAAITFETNSEHWPADLYIDVGSTIALAWIGSVTSDEIALTNDNLAFVRRAHEAGYCATLAISLLRESAIGTVLWHLHQADFKTWNRYDDSIELVFRKPVKFNFQV